MEGAGEPAMSLDLLHRFVALPVVVKQASLRRLVLQAASLVSSGDVNGANVLATALAERARSEEVLREPSLRAAALARLYVDLVTAGWELTVEDGQVFGAPPCVEEIRSDDALTRAKAITRGTMLARVREQVSGEARLVDEVEPAIQRLIADGPSLAETLSRQGAGAVRPYLQAARRADPPDVHTGLSVHSIYRYLRYWWAFPYNDTPGRSLPFLIRDAGQPGHPVCGLLCLSSPLLRLTDRDDALGLTPAWLEAAVAGLVALAEPDAVAALRGVDAQLTSQGRAALSPTRMHRDLGHLLRLDVPLLRWSSRTPREARLERVTQAATRISTDLIREVRQAIEGMSLADLGVTLEAALREPAVVRESLREVEERARQAWENGRTGSVRRDEEADLQRLFLKKRAHQLSDLLLGWAGLASLRTGQMDALAGLRALALGTRLSLGASVGRGLTEALLCRKTRFASTQIADISLCGAIPPYNGLLGGKLAAMLAMSRNAASVYHANYDGKRSRIQSRMAGEDVIRPAELVALTTTSFYGVGSSQYNRVSLPAGLGGHRWEEVGATRGHGTLHLSAEVCRLLSELVVLIEQKQLITSTFGEGPSERLRKLRDGLSAMGLPADRLLQHGFTRLVYVASLGAPMMPGAAVRPARHHTDGPTEEQVADAWRERWLAPRLERAIVHARAFDASTVLLSRRFPTELALRADTGPLLVYDGAADADASWGEL